MYSSTLALITIAVIIVVPVVISINLPFDEAVEAICRSQEEYGFCKSVIDQNPLTPEGKNMYGLTALTITLAEYNATQTFTFLQQLLASTTDPKMKEYLTVCSNSYNVVSQAFRQAHTDFDNGKYSEMLHGEQPTARVIANCNTIFSSKPGDPSAMNERNRQMRILLTMAIVTGHIFIK